MLPFVPLSWDDRERYNDLYQICPVKSSEYSFFSLWGWLEHNPLDVAWDEGFCWLRSRGKKTGICSPVGDWDSVDWEKAFLCYFAPKDVLLDIPEYLVNLLKKLKNLRFSASEDRNEWEYLHSVPELIALKGNKYAHKRAHVKSFLSNYSWEYVPLLPEDFDELLRFQAEWRTLHGRASVAELNEEDQAIRRALERWEDFPFMGALLKAEGRTVGYTVAEELNLDTIDIRFEKALVEYTGSYQAINQLFLEKQGSGYTWVNREEDMGSEGMRGAKMSYHPAAFVKKYQVEYLGTNTQ